MLGSVPTGSRVGALAVLPLVVLDRRSSIAARRRRLVDLVHVGLFGLQVGAFRSCGFLHRAPLRRHRRLPSIAAFS